ncbi:AlpA family phage regulatory protein [Sulfitobacter pseudonitzschiae]|uniref:AlpA family phage regulatory protein n=1 Tax=Pseudosulfitobacter pseudonitzschiae TaxID=1402135 RepID=A0A9Q2RXF2_9RHOB|nr:AlpA family phage regulatory protein [Pseudosulfitobacter pseudonitzschiae]MBM2299332.1 AlpA family phage regulatory protein [Pseudosulfitobacter pseudonitzschiae]MBM2304945.1 AlpA family phage regulatory protein [Pseudosulfitobacter pseudonitzschiae]MBM2314722.1 AlpA family phage regulatory protein [Pseudosulfitobacter pseudonitzschiae]MBM2319630.1 AlpA family phage regulatory protein [Pseudosulfitobacter pseudonitzschiae]
MQQSSLINQGSGNPAILITTEPSSPKAPTFTARNQLLYRVSEIAGPDGMFPLSISSWWAGVRSGLYPQPVKLGPRLTAWRAEDLEHLAQNGIEGATFVSSPNSSNGGQS